MIKKMLLFCVLIASFAFAQNEKMTFYAHDLSIRDNSTGAINESEINIKITLSNNYLTIFSKKGKIIFEFYGDAFSTSETVFYSYAYDPYEVKCRIWVKIYSREEILVGIEYSDFSFLYSCSY